MTKREFGRESVKMHMTLIKVKRGDGHDDDNTKTKNIRRRTFDARNILENYGKFDFGMQVNEIHLAILKSNDTDGFYKCTGSIKL